jgi:mRNA interferase MazF
MKTTQIEVTISRALLERAESVAQQLGLLQNELFEEAVARWLAHNDKRTGHETNAHRVIHQGDLYWVTLADGRTSAAIPHPYVIIQDDLLNHSRLETVVACALTSNIQRISNTPGNVLLESGEANLPKQSVIEVSKVSTLAKTQLGEYIGSLSGQRIEQIFAGMRFLQRAAFDRG